MELSNINIDVVIAISIFLLSLLLVVVLRKNIGNEYEIKNTDILIGLIPLALWLILTGKITSFEYGDLKIASAFTKANNKPISQAITAIYKSNLKSAEKGSSYELENILKTKPEALIFYSGENRYSPIAIRSYISELSKSTLKYIIIKKSDNRDFIGIISIEAFMSQAFDSDPNFTPENFAEWLNTGNNEKISSIAGIITNRNTVMPETPKQIALEKMEKLNTRFLPVTKNNAFVGIIEMEKLSTSLLMDISKSLSDK